MENFNALGANMSNLWQLSDAESRSLSAENPNGEKGKGAMAEPNGEYSHAMKLGRGWKVRPNITVPAGETATIADVDGPGALQQIWMTTSTKTNNWTGANQWRFYILRIYWDDQEQPSVECPIGDFFCMGWGRYAQLSSLAVCVNPARAFNCYWQMPFRKKCRMTLENISDQDMVLFYQINYTLTDVPDDAAYFHAQFRRSNPLPYKTVHTVLDGVQGRGHYVGTYMAWGINNCGWWGEGETKFYIDGDGEFPTICGTGTEDYFCGSYNFDVGKENGGYREFNTPYVGMHQVIRPDGLYDSQQRFGLYRWHITDPVRFKSDIRVTQQALGWRDKGYLPLQDDIASVAYWYQTLPTAPFPELPSIEELEVM
ncbi:MAG: glycoside hydrolase family 172 protein [Candidatus Sumerlaeota bacterium]